MLRFDCMHFHGLFFFLPLVIIFCNVPCSRLPSGLYILLWAPVFWSRLLALRGHVTNASFKQWVGILLMPKIDRAHKNYVTPEIWEEMHLRGIFYSTLISQQSSMICIGCHVGGHTLALQHVAKTTFCFYLVKRLVVRFRCAENVTTSSFQQFPWSLSAKFLFRKR